MRYLVATIFFALTSFGLGQSSSNDKTIYDADLELKVGMTSHAYDERVSGTNVNGVFRVSWGAMPEVPGWDYAQILALEVECDSMSETLTPSGMISPSYSRTIRFASTHFNDGASIEFQVTGFIYLEDWDTSSWEVIEISHTAKVRAYNKGLAVAANVTEDGIVIDENDPKWSTSLRYSSREIANYAITSSIEPPNDFSRHT